MKEWLIRLEETIERISENARSAIHEKLTRIISEYIFVFGKLITKIINVLITILITVGRMLLNGFVLFLGVIIGIIFIIVSSSDRFNAENIITYIFLLIISFCFLGLKQERINKSVALSSIVNFFCVPFVATFFLVYFIDTSSVAGKWFFIIAIILSFFIFSLPFVIRVKKDKTILNTYKVALDFNESIFWIVLTLLTMDYLKIINLFPVDSSNGKDIVEKLKVALFPFLMQPRLLKAYINYKLLKL
ncbi:hypothetical protein [Paenibacillus sp. Soil724D2]|uniref:hypothetical protein n=1 Tax=Paenibacillus sp. (strain Soil724D2) TaxID=1736392 RepID=UPI0007136455|nr:hypothetical protein [Paenibacillus sp. Soil724D2]KRE50633.1 hypothetical protein ASG85_20485 [Paenibacillus sp. Soil724D2]